MKLTAESDPTYFLQTDRLGFRLWTPDDLSLARALWGDLQVTRLIGGPFSEQDIEERLAREIVSMRLHQVQYWPLFLRSDGSFVGCCGLRAREPEKNVFELGFHLRPAYRGKGLAEESARAVIHLGFDSLGVKGLFAGPHPDNAASRRLLTKLGFVLTHEELYPPTGKMHLCYFLRLPE